MSILYKDADLDRKADKLATIFPYVGWEEIHELTPQIMEIVDCLALIRDGSTDKDKKETAVALLDRVLDRVESIEGVRESVPSLIDVINAASKGEYAINKEQHNEKTS